MCGIEPQNRNDKSHPCGSRQDGFCRMPFVRTQLPLRGWCRRGGCGRHRHGLDVELHDSDLDERAE